MASLADNSLAVFIFLGILVFLSIIGFLQTSDWSKYWKRGLVECEAVITNKLPAQSNRSIYGATGGHQEVGSTKQYVGYFFIVEYINQEGKLVRGKTIHTYKHRDIGQKNSHSLQSPKYYSTLSDDLISQLFN
jgi:hypothetical protein